MFVFIGAALAELLKKRATLVGELRKWHDAIRDDAGEPRAYTADEKAEFEKREGEIGAMEERIQREEKLEEIERRRNDRRSEEIERNGGNGRRNGRLDGLRTALAIQGWVRARRGEDLTAEQSEAMGEAGIKPERSEIDLRILSTEELELVPPQIARANRQNGKLEHRMKTTATYGGELIPAGFVYNWELALLAIGQLRNFATILRTPTGNALPWPTTNDTGNVGELLAEEGGAATQDVATAAVTFNAYKYSSKIVKVSAELFQDSAFNLAEMLGSLLGTRIARITNTHFTTGTGSGQPNGIVTASTQAFVMASASAIAPSEVQRMPYEVDPEYLTAPGAAWMMNSAIVKQIRLLRDDSGGAGTGQWMWIPGLIAGEPDSLAGYPICYNQAMASAFAVNAKIMLFGDLRKYVIRDVGSIRLFHLGELYRANDQEGFIAFSRHDGDLLDAGTHPVKYAQMAAS